MTLPIELYSTYCYLHILCFIVGVIPKEGLARLVSAKSSFGMATPNNLRPVLRDTAKVIVERERLVGKYTFTYLEFR